MPILCWLRLNRLLVAASLLAATSAFAFDEDTAFKLSGGDNESRTAALHDVVEHQDLAALPFLQQLAGDNVKVSADHAFVMDGDKASDPVTGEAVTLPADADDVVNSNYLRLELTSTIAALKLASDDPAVRLDAAKTLQDSDPDPSRLALIQAAEAKETVSSIKQMLLQVRANIQLTSPDKATRLEAIAALAHTTNPNIRELLSTRLAPGGETDPEVRAALTKGIAAIDSGMALYEYAGRLFTGISLGSILLLAALGLAITYGLMGIINMAHGELMMIGAYTTYVVQNLCRTYLPGAFDYYLVAAVPAAFVVTAVVGAVIERLVLRYLYGRSLETLLATWGVSLILMQLVRTIFGAQNVGVENPRWMSGGIEIAANLSLPFNRIVIIGFSIAVLGLVAVVLSRTRLGLFVRAVTQNRKMASCVGVPTGRIDTMAFAMGAGIAGLAGVALSQIGNVGPDLGQHYIVDSFMVVVLGGVGQLAGAVIAAIGLGILSKLLESAVGPVLAEIAVLVLIVIVIQRRPQGLFALRGRSAEA
jgi:urea transport system permease protein